LNTFIVDSSPSVMNSVRADLTAKQPGADEDEAAGWNVTSERPAQLRRQSTSSLAAPIRYAGRGLASQAYANP
jgi:hypothetical protein